MNIKQKRGYTLFYDQALTEISKSNFGNSMILLGYCHILSKNSYISHAKIHGLMLYVGIITKDWKEVRVQLFRTIMAFTTLRFLSGNIPNGNPGTSHHGFFDSLPIPIELREYFE
ncbi:DUF3703 domain-containing protein [Vibrio owensii]|uniref:DUF3703 domain-containing protein n=1 Tax=Vibrio owensii TaxID=696485 RepID=UPI0037485CE5